MGTENTKARVLIVDRHPVTRLGLSTLINSQPDMCVAGEIGHSSEVLFSVESLHPDAVVLEVSVKNGSGLELIQQISSAPGQTPVLALSLFDERVYAPRALRVGASDFISKDRDCETIVTALRSVLRGQEADESQQVSGSAPETGSSAFRSLLDNLTDRELEVFELLGHGLTVQQIANRLSVTANTVESYRERIKKKLVIKSGTELTVRAAQWITES